jgi:hypothetical protein
MHTFHLITKKIIDLDTTNNNSQIFSNIHKINFFIFLQREYSIQTKFNFLKETLKNIFNTNEMNEEFINYFNKIQKTYYAFSRFSFIYRYKKAKIMVDTDLILNEISENNKFVYCLFQNNCKYLFNIHELIKIIHNSIANSYMFFSSPFPIKNPYNNIILDKSTLYNIYFFIRTKTSLQPELFYYYFKTNFNLNKFNNEYQYLLRNFAIKNYLNNNNKDVLYNDIEYMIEDYNELIKYRNYQIIIDHTFPKDLLVNIMTPYLKLFLISQYSLMYTDRLVAKNLLKQKLYEFNKFNPQFGRKIYKKVLNISISNNTTENFQYNTIHIAFNERENIKDKNEFMNSHATKLREEINHDDADDDDDDPDDDNADDDDDDPDDDNADADDADANDADADDADANDADANDDDDEND